MKTILSSLVRSVAVCGLAGFLLMSTSCMQSYDAYGRPMQTVDPGLAVAGVLAAGLIGYSLADGDHHGHSRSRYHGSHYDSYDRPYYRRHCR